MTDEQIIKAFECHRKGLKYCKECPLQEPSLNVIRCNANLLELGTDLIKSQQAKIKELADKNIGLQYDLQLAKEELLTTIENQQAEIDRLKTEKDNPIKTYHECQVENIKEFAEKLKQRLNDMGNLSSSEYRSVVIDIDDLVGEMTRFCLNCGAKNGR